MRSVSWPESGMQRLFATALLGAMTGSMACVASQEPTLVDRPDLVAAAQVAFRDSEPPYELQSSPSGRWTPKVRAITDPTECPVFLALDLRDAQSEEVRTLFTFYEGSACSGYNLRARWQPDGKAVQLVGFTLGFDHWSQKAAAFDFAYFPDDNVMVELKPTQYWPSPSLWERLF